MKTLNINPTTYATLATVLHAAELLISAASSI
jgi:hypothetical protein